MSLLNSLNDELKAAMRAKDSLKLEALEQSNRQCFWQTATGDMDLLRRRKLITTKTGKTAKRQCRIFRQQNRHDLAAPEEDQACHCQFLPNNYLRMSLKKY